MYKEDKDYLVNGKVLNEIDRIMSENSLISGYTVEEIAESVEEDVDEVLLAYLVRDWECDESVKDMMDKLDTDFVGVMDFIEKGYGSDAFEEVSETLAHVLKEINYGVL